MNIVVYTALFGNIDPLWSPPPIAGKSQYVCFSDRKRRECGLWTQRLGEQWPMMIEDSERYGIIKPGWQVRIVKRKAGYSLRKMARWCKIMAHEHLQNADVTIWLDGNVRLMIPPARVVKKWLGDADLAIFDHNDRHCLYQEALFCTRKGKGSAARLRGQMQAYRKSGMPQNWGLAETKCVIRRNTPAMQQLNKMWWAEIERHSLRDQVSLPFVCWKLGIRWKVIPGRAGLPTFPGKQNKAFWYTKHRKE